MISGKYFVLESDDRFPFSFNPSGWLPLTGAKQSENKSAPENLTIYAISGYNNLYIGSDARHTRPGEHKNSLLRNDHHNNYLQAVINKYGIGEFYYQIVTQVPAEHFEYRNQIENSYIRYFDTFHNGYNLTEFADTSMLGAKHSQAAKDKMSKARIGVGRKPFKIISPEGEVHEGTCLKEFCREQGLDDSTMRSVVNGDYYQHYGWRAYSAENLCKFPVAEHSLVDPMGNIFTFEKIVPFCAENNLVPAEIRRLLSGGAKYSKGWRKFNGSNNIPFTEEKIVQSNWSEFTLFHPDFGVVIGRSLRKWMLENNIPENQRNTISRVNRGIGKTKSQWRRATEEEILKYKAENP